MAYCNRRELDVESWNDQLFEPKPILDRKQKHHDLDARISSIENFDHWKSMYSTWSRIVGTVLHIHDEIFVRTVTSYLFEAWNQH